MTNKTSEDTRILKSYSTIAREQSIRWELVSDIFGDFLDKEAVVLERGKYTIIDTNTDAYRRAEQVLFEHLSEQERNAKRDNRDYQDRIEYAKILRQRGEDWKADDLVARAEMNFQTEFRFYTQRGVEFASDYDKAMAEYEAHSKEIWGQNDYH